ncbi:exodeoxyribonuclease VII large subunit [bacterium]|nr:exodeoxyribonuclease VII large subunit [bacterium]
MTEITREIKRVIHEGFGTLWVEGEISGYKRHTSGHHYFTLKDGSAQIPCAMWRMNASRQTFPPQDGMKVQAWGNLEVYEPAGRYQLIVVQLRPAGVGELQRAFEERVEKLRAEGLFALERKRSLPKFPREIGLVTSADGAALQDMRTVAARRWPAAQLILAPVKVQGAGAAEEIAAAVDRFSHENRVNVIVVGRGGGSLEDLWAFNEEIVARAIYRSRIPVVSAVGHEVDVTIADFVADVRAPTPSAAMELVLPDRPEVVERVADLARRLSSRRAQLLRSLRERLTSLRSHWALRQPVNVVYLASQRLDEIRARFVSTCLRSLSDRRGRIERLSELAGVLSPQAMLERGYSIVRDEVGRVVRDATELQAGGFVSLTFARGEADAEIRTVRRTECYHDRENEA